MPKNKTLALIILSLCLIGQGVHSQPKDFINVHFLYGSKPSKEYRDTERKWFGGRLGGHVGIETHTDSVLNFMRKGKLHLFASSRHRNSRYAIYSTTAFWGIFRTHGTAVKKTTVVVPVTPMQKQKLDSISAIYLKQTPYDYAFFGMRCSAAAYDILAQIGILTPHSHRVTYMKIFYPRKLRKRLLKIAAKNNWEVNVHEGALTRKWERD